MCCLAPHSVKAFATRCEAELDRLDVLVNNAGMGALKFDKTADGYEEMLQVNVLSTGLLSVLLLPLLAKSATVNAGAGSKEFSPHLPIVGSSSKHSCRIHFQLCFQTPSLTCRVYYRAAHKSAVYVRPSSSSLLLDLNDPSSPNIGLLNGYRLTKLLDVFLTRKLAALPLAEQVTVNSVDPGLCKSDLRRNAPGLVAWLFNAIAWKTETGAACVNSSYEPGCLSLVLEADPCICTRRSRTPPQRRRLPGRMSSRPTWASRQAL